MKFFVFGVVFVVFVISVFFVSTFFVNAIDPSNVICGDTSECFVYNASCPSGTMLMFEVGNEICDGEGGAHLARHYNTIYTYKMCCNKILTCSGDGCNVVFGYDQIIPNEEYGGHVFDKEYYNPAIHTQLKMGNLITYKEGSNCDAGDHCLVKASIPMNNSHVWDCSYDPAGAHTTSICYNPNLIAYDCLEVGDYQKSCGDPEEAVGGPGPGGDTMYCSHGENLDLSPGACCIEGDYATFNPVSGEYQCASSFDIWCGFNSSNPLHACGLGDYGIDERPVEYFEDDYFAVPGCVDFVNRENCCFNTTKYHTLGNFYCNIDASRPSDVPT